MMIFDLLPVGEENAIPKIDLLKVTGLEDRLLRRKVQLERLAGLPILTNCEKGGYYRPADPDCLWWWPGRQRHCHGPAYHNSGQRDRL